VTNYLELSKLIVKQNFNNITIFIKHLISTIPAGNCNQIKCCDALLVCSDADRGYVYEGKAYAQITDSLGDILKKKGVLIQSVSQGFTSIKNSKTYGKSHNRNHFILRNFIISRLLKIIFGHAVAESWRLKDRIENWEKILKKSNAKIVFSIQPEIPLCKAGHALAVQIFDVQHGVISDSEDNPYYWSENLKCKDQNAIPNGFLCWNEASASVLQTLSSSKGYSVKVIGNPWFARFSAPVNEDLLVHKELSLIKERKKEIPTILLTLQYNLGEYAPDYVDNGVMSKHIQAVIKETSDKYFWFIRLHPAQIHNKDAGYTKKYLKKTFGELQNIDWSIASRAALPAILSISDLHITHFSAATIEAAWMGVKTGLLDPHIELGKKHADLYKYERLMGYAELIPLEEEKIKSFINLTLNEKMKSGLKNKNLQNKFKESIVISLFGI
jgi:hypothetical protein